MSDKRGFVLDAKSMGLSNPEKPTTTGQQKCHNSAHENTEKAGKAGARDFHSTCNVISEPLPTEHFRQVVDELPKLPDEAFQMNLKLNKEFLRRLADIDSLDSQNSQGGDSMSITQQVRLVTYQEWVEFLLHSNSVIFSNISELENATYGKVMACMQSVKGEQQHTLDDYRKQRKDLCTIVKFLQDAYYKGVWDTTNMSLETMTVNQLLGLPREQRHPQSESEKMAECMKSLVNEMASKHDEVCHLKSQLCALDEVVQTARQKLILKDQCIAQLNQQLLQIKECLANVPQPSPCYEAPKEEVQIGDMVASCFLENLCLKDREESKILKTLDTELNELLALHSRHEIKSMEACRNRLYGFFEKFSKELVEATRNLENVRSQLRALRDDVNKPGSDPYSTPISLVGPDPDGTSLEALREQMQAYNNATKEMHGNYLQLVTENNDLHSQLKSESLINTRSSDIIKGIADKLVEMGFQDFTYNEIYETDSTRNPFCAVLNELYDNKKHNNSLEEQLLVKTNQRLACQMSCLQEKLEDRDAQVSELQAMIHSYSDFSDNQRLKEEIYSLKQTHSAQQHKLRELTTLLKSREELRAGLCKEHEELERKYEDQCKELKKSKKRQQCLEESVSQGEMVLEEVTVERNLLREEIMALKEKEATAAGRERALGDQLSFTQKELNNARRVIQNLQDHLKQGKQKHREVLEQLEVANITMNQQMREFECECQRMRGKLKQQADVNQQQEEIISSFRQWKDAQIRADEARRRCEKRAEEHISLLVEENQTLVHEYRALHRDHSLLEAEIQRVKQAIQRTTTSPQTTSPDCARVAPHMGDDQMSARLRSLANTSQRLAIHSKMLIDQTSLRKGAQQEQENPSLSRNTQSSDSPLLEQHPNP
ncbi:myosin-7 [Drosophila madeirensis]|uniref:Myosin-7 n=1 Tax=Drosophila madeirensis TaxID=30013 RepID=A0AAU9FGW8_DROMD